MKIIIECSGCPEPLTIEKGAYNYKRSLGQQNFYHKVCCMRVAKSKNRFRMYQRKVDVGDFKRELS